MNRQQAEDMLKRAQERLMELDVLEERYGKEPPAGSVIRIVRDLNGYRYSYAIIRAGNGKWFASGARSGDALSGLSWSDLVEWMSRFTILHYEVILPPDELQPLGGVSASHQNQDDPGSPSPWEGTGRARAVSGRSTESPPSVPELLAPPVGYI